MTHLEQYDSLPEGSLFRIAGSEKVYQKQGELCVEMFRIDGSWQPNGTMEAYEGINPMEEDLERYMRDLIEDDSSAEIESIQYDCMTEYEMLMNAPQNN